MSRLYVWDGSAWVLDNYPPSARVGTGSVTVITSCPASVNSTANFTISGTVKTSGGVNIVNGTAQLYKNGVAYGAAYNVTAGVFSFTVSENATSTYYVKYTPGAGNVASQSATKTVTYSTLVLTTFTKTYACSGSASYNGDGTKRTDVGTDIYQGYFSTNHDEQRSVIVFPTTVQTDLAGAYDLLKVEVYLNCLHWGPDSGGTARVRTCNNTSAPSTWSGVASLSGYDETAWTTKTGAKWCDLNAIMGTLANWQSGGTKKGLALYAASTATEYYGYFAGNGASGEPQLRITYRKYV